MADRLAIWLNDLHVAKVERGRKGKLSLTYTEQALATYPGGVPLLSLNLPLTPERYPNGRTRALLDGPRKPIQRSQTWLAGRMRRACEA